MESPLKELIQKHPTVLKPYKPEPPRDNRYNYFVFLEDWNYVKDK